jgi:uncharacterized protein YdaU (DUF1376 family)
MNTKTPAFQFYAADYLADEQASLMTLEEEGAYIRLLAYCWREGSIPADETLLSRLCKGASTTVLRVVTACFQPCADRPDRLTHKRLDDEREKQAEWREKSAAGGRKSAEKRWAKKPSMPSSLDSKSFDAESKGGYKGGTKGGVTLQSSSSSSRTSNDVTPASETAAQTKSPDPAKQVAQATTDPADEQHWSESPLTKPKPFRVICERLDFAGIAYEHYRKQALVAAQDGDIRRTIQQWTSWIRNFLNRQQAAGPLLTAAHELPTAPTPKSQLPPPGQEQPGQIIYIDGVPGDQNLDRMKAHGMLKHFPSAVVVSLAYPLTPYHAPAP